MIKYDGQAITYDDIGNPLTYRDGFTFSWSNGRQLDSYTKDGKTVNYTYDADGMRLSKTVDGVEYTYLYQDGLLVQETRGSKIFDYSYDANGNIRMLKYTVNANVIPTYYYYALNSRGDVIGLYDSNGNLTAKYTYDAWGNEVSVTYSNGNVITHDNHIAKLQPFRYRSYYYDSDSSLYYVTSRYYDPVTHRFINADDISLVTASPTTLTDKNLYAYCDNNPIVRADSDGEFWHIVIGAAVGATVGFMSSVADDLINGNDVNLGAAFASAGFGALSGVLVSVGLPAPLVSLGGAAISGADSFVNQGIKNGFDKINYTDVVVSSALGLTTTNIYSKGNAKHLMKQGTQATKKIVSKNTSKKVVQNSVKYYTSQTKKLVYGPIKKNAFSNLRSNIFISVFNKYVRR